MFKKLLTAAALAVGLSFAVSAGTTPASALPTAKPAITQDNAGVTQVRHRRRWGHRGWRHHRFHRRHHWRHHYYRPYYYQPYYYGSYGYPYYYHRRHHHSGIYLSFGRGWY